MPQSYTLTIDGKSFDLNWDRDTPPTSADIAPIVNQYRQQVKARSQAQIRQNIASITQELGITPEQARSQGIPAAIRANQKAREEIENLSTATYVPPRDLSGMTFDMSQYLPAPVENADPKERSKAIAKRAALMKQVGMSQPPPTTLHTGQNALNNIVGSAISGKPLGQSPSAVGALIDRLYGQEGTYNAAQRDSHGLQKFALDALGLAEPENLLMGALGGAVAGGSKLGQSAMLGLFGAPALGQAYDAYKQGHPEDALAGLGAFALPMVAHRLARGASDLYEARRGASASPFDGLEPLIPDTPQKAQQALLSPPPIIVDSTGRVVPLESTPSNAPEVLPSDNKMTVTRNKWSDYQIPDQTKVTQGNWNDYSAGELAKYGLTKPISGLLEAREYPQVQYKGGIYNVLDQTGDYLRLRNENGKVVRVKSANTTPYESNPIPKTETPADLSKPIAQQIVEPATNIPSVAPAEVPPPSAVEAQPLPPAPVSPQEGVPSLVQTSNNIRNIPSDQIQFDPERFQYKRSTTPMNARVWNPDFAGVLSVWRDPANGNTYVVNGHHRLELAQRLGVPDVNVRYRNAPDAPTAKASGALINIAEGQGTALDAANFLRHSPEGVALLEQAGVPSNGKVAKDALALAKLNNLVFGNVERRVITEQQGVAIGRTGLDDAGQTMLLKVLTEMEAKGKTVTPDKIQQISYDINKAPSSTSNEFNLFGEEGSFTQNLYAEKADLATEVYKSLKQDKNTFGSLANKKKAQVLERGANKINTAENARIAEESSMLSDAFNTARRFGDPRVDEILNNGAREIANGTRKTEVTNRATEAIKRILREADARTMANSNTGGKEPHTSGGTLFGGEEAQSGQPLETSTPTQRKTALRSKPQNGQTGAMLVADISPIMDKVEAITKNIKSDTTGGAFRKFKQIVGDKANDLVHTLAASRSIADWGANKAEQVVKNLDPQSRKFFERVMMDSQAQILERKEVTDHNVPTLNPAEKRAWEAYRKGVVPSNPKVAEVFRKVEDAIDMHRAIIEPEILALRQTASPSLTPIDTGDLPFASLVPEGREGKYGQVSGRASEKLSAKDTRYVRERTGKSGGYREDYVQNIADNYHEVTKKAGLRGLYDNLRAEGFLLTPEEMQTSSNTWNAEKRMFIGKDGKEYPAVRDNNLLPERNAQGEPVKQDYSLPKPLYDQISEIVNGSFQRPGIHNSLGKVGSLSTQFALATIKDATNHAWRVASLASKFPFVVGDKLATGIQRGLDVGSPRIGTLYRIFNTDMSIPENRDVLQDLIHANAGSDRPFKEFVERLKIPGISQISNFTHDVLFGLPEGKGIDGFDLRARVAIEKLRRQLEPELVNDPQRMREVANQFGQYMNNQDGLVKFLKQFNPYASTQLPMRMAEMKQLIGDSGIKPIDRKQAVEARVETLWKAHVGRFVGLSLLYYALNGHLPTLNDQKNLSVQVGTDNGEPVYLDSGTSEPTVDRAMRTTGTRALLRDAVKGDMSATGQKALADVSNGILELFQSPIANTALSPLGLSMHITPNTKTGEFGVMNPNPVDPQTGKHTVAMNTKNTIASAVPILSDPARAIQYLFPESLAAQAITNTIGGKRPGDTEFHDTGWRVANAIQELGFRKALKK